VLSMSENSRHFSRPWVRSFIGYLSFTVSLVLGFTTNIGAKTERLPPKRSLVPPSRTICTLILHKSVGFPDYLLDAQHLDELRTMRKLRYPYGIDPLVEPDAHIQYGAESEFVLWLDHKFGNRNPQIEKILEYYAPPPEQMTLEVWRALTIDQKMKWSEKNLSNTKFGRLYRVKDADGIDFLPPSIHRDFGGNLEFVLDPVNTLEELWYQVGKLNEMFGTGSLQASVSVKDTHFYGVGLGGTRIQASRKFKGQNFFFQELDTLTKLRAGYRKYQEAVKEDPKTTFLAAPSFAHIYLGPLKAVHVERMDQLLEEFGATVENGGSIRESDSLRIRVKINETSQKYRGGTVYRPDLGAGQGRSVQEIRDANTNEGILFDRLLRLTHFIQNGYGHFEAFADLQGVDHFADFDRLPQDVREMLLKIIRTRTGHFHSPYFQLDEERDATTVARNFAYPMKNWSQHIALLSNWLPPQMGKTSTLGELVADAQTHYLLSLRKTAAEFHKGTISEAEVASRVHGALVTFAAESGLAETFENYYQHHLFESPKENSYWALLAHPNEKSGQTIFQNAYEGDIWTGPIELRLKKLQAKWPNQVKIVDQVLFAYDNDAGNLEAEKKSPRQLVILSKAGLSGDQLSQLSQDYLSAVSYQTISFPMGQNPGYLYARIGAKTLRAYQSFDEWNYRPPSEKNIEPVVLLNPAEDLKLRFYLNRIRDNRESVIGLQEYRGAFFDIPDRTLRRNIPERILDAQNICAIHNCTSWFTTAPIGPHSETLYQLMGASTEIEVHTNPGWWQSYLTGLAPPSRVPFVIHWTDETLSDASQHLKSGQQFRTWTYDRK